nr:MAPEG family protein [Pseudoruegeria sp. HB172150]
MNDELSILLLYGLLMAVVLVLKTTGMLTQFDMGYLLSSRDENRSLEGMLGRMDRAINNSVIAMALVTPPILVIAIRDQSSAHSILAAQIFLAARTIYFPAYMFRITGLRTLVWLIALIAIFFLYFLAL